MIHKNDLKVETDYWYVFIPESAINLQTVKLEKIHLEALNEYEVQFRVYRYKKNEEFLTVMMTLDITDDCEYPCLFPMNEKEDAELYWAKEFFHKFKMISGVEFTQFVDLYKKIQKDHPEWII